MQTTLGEKAVTGIVNRIEIIDTQDILLNNQIYIDDPDEKSEFARYTLGDKGGLLEQLEKELKKRGIYLYD